METSINLIQFSASVSVTLTIHVGLFYLSVFPAQLTKPTRILLSSSSLLILCKQVIQRETTGLSQSLFPIYLTLLEPSINRESLLCGLV